MLAIRKLERVVELVVVPMGREGDELVEPSGQGEVVGTGSGLWLEVESVPVLWMRRPLIGGLGGGSVLGG